MTDSNDLDLFIDALNNLPDDIITAKYDGYIHPVRLRQKNIPEAPYDKTIDLHGLTKREALVVLQSTLTHSRGKQLKILVITGKGNKSEGGRGVIREAVQNFLDKAGSLYVREYRFASHKNGGDGAIEIVTK
jgi:DNA-nicking Smr family endonuclease